MTPAEVALAAALAVSALATLYHARRLGRVLWRLESIETALYDQARRVNHLADQQRLAIKREELISTAVAKGFEGTNKGLVFTAGIVDGLLRNDEDTVRDVEATMLALHSMTLDVERARAETLTFSGDTIKQRSAVQQLASRIGDADAASFLELRAEGGSLVGIDAMRLRDAAQRLRRRDSDEPPELA
jgi:hypothetical protein